MSDYNIGISTDSACDMPKRLAEINDIGVIRFYVKTETGLFRDGDEISSQNVAEYYRKGGAALVTDEAQVDEYAEFFRDMLSRYSEIVHIAVSSGTSNSFDRATIALEQLGMLSDRVKVVDSETLSTGMAHLVLKAVELRDKGCSSHEIVSAVEEMRDHLNVSFISQSPKQMFKSGRMSNAANSFCSSLHVHPIFKLKSGRIVLGGIGVGDMRGAVKRYIRKQLRRTSGIDTHRLFITHVGLSFEDITRVKNEVAKKIRFEDVTVTDASASISGNCGEGTVGLLFLKKY